MCSSAVLAAEKPLTWPGPCEIASLCTDTRYERMPRVDTASATPEQQAILEEIAASPRKCAFGPFGVLLRVPELLKAVQALGSQVHYSSTLPKALSEWATLIVGRELQSPYIWYIHLPAALSAGVQPDVLNALALQQKSVNMSAEETLIYAFVIELMRTHSVSDKIYGQTVQHSGERRY